MSNSDLDDALRVKFAKRARADAPSKLIGRVLAIPAASPHRRGWLARLIFGGPSLMIGATKVFATIGILALSGALLVGAAQRQSPDGPTTGAEALAAGLQPAHVSGMVVHGEWPDADQVAIGNDMYEWVSDLVTATWASSDERLSGSGPYLEHGLQHFSSYTGLRASEWTIENDGGAWSGSGDAFSSADGGRDFLVLIGSGGYEGLSAYIAIGPGQTASTEVDERPFEGVIFPTSPPSAPTP